VARILTAVPRKGGKVAVKGAKPVGWFAAKKTAKPAAKVGGKVAVKGGKAVATSKPAKAVYVLAGAGIAAIVVVTIVRRKKGAVEHAANVAKGAAHDAAPGTGREVGELDDVTLARKVETEIFRAHDAPKGSVSVDVQAGVAYLRGETTHDWIDRLGTEARKVDGIKGVKNLLHAPGTPTPAPEPRFLAAEHYHRS